jgi:hypothetical protein
MGTRDRQENEVGDESIEARYDRVPMDHPQERPEDEPGVQNVGATGGSGRTGGGLGVSTGDYTETPPDPARDGTGDAQGPGTGKRDGA